MTLETLARGAASLATAVAIGSLATQLWLAGASLPAADALTWRLRRLQFIAALMGVVALLCRAAAHTLAVVGDDALTADAVRLVVGESRWGHAWRWPMGAAVVAAVVGWQHRRRPRVVLSMAAFALLCAATPRLGHGASSAWQAVGHAWHVAATSVWLGTVIVLGGTIGGDAADERAALAVAVRRFSPWALATAVVTFLTGAVLALTYVGGLDALLSSDYGRLLLLKLALVGGIALCGYGNWQRARQHRPHDRRLIRVEGVLAVVTLAVTALLGETAHP